MNLNKLWMNQLIFYQTQLPALIFFLQINQTPNFIVESGVFPSLYVKCHHQIFSKLNLNVVYPPPYQHLIWDYKKANFDCIRKFLISIDWDFVLSNKNVHQKAQYLNKVSMNVFSYYIPNQLITIDDKDPPWMNDEIKNKIKKRDIFINNWRNIN